MRSFLISFVLAAFFYSGTAKAAAPLNDELQNATTITNISAFCSADAAFNNLEATSSSITIPRQWPSIGKDVWFKFTATKYDVNISVAGLVNASTTNTLINPLVALYSFETTNNTLGEMVGTSFRSNNVTSLYKGALVIGQVYLI
ncbi:hypothetical protein ACJVDH_16255 [Pedobacter sp. AW1-32]|uniref:hypothetical protein n=1 Tax=Pedobacter sp. AW1-32 TaxID=3383026 RepID=UPI003FED93D6